jgi:hypothetical protein
MDLLKKKELELNRLLPDGCLLMLRPDRVILDDILCNDTWGHPIPGESKRHYGGIFAEKQREPVMMFLSKKWTTKPFKWLNAPVEYHLAGICNEKPVMTRDPVDIRMFMVPKYEKEPKIWILNKELRNE